MNPLDHNLFFATLPKEKREFIKAFADAPKPKDTKKALPFLLTYINLAKKKQLSFSKPEIELLCDILSKDLSDDEKAKVQKLLAMIKS